MRLTIEKHTFVCRVSDDAFEAVVGSRRGDTRRLVDAAIEPLPRGVPEPERAASLARFLKRLGYRREHVVCVVNRHSLTEHYVTVPSVDPDEISRMMTLQTVKLLPVSPEDLVTCHDSIPSDTPGFTDVNLCVAHKTIFERHERLFRSAGVRDLSLVPAAAGVSGLYRMFGNDADPALLISIEGHRAEVLLWQGGRYRASRLTAGPGDGGATQFSFAHEVHRINDFFIREMACAEPRKAVIFASPKETISWSGILEEQLGIPVECLRYWEGVPADRRYHESVTGMSAFLAPLSGLALVDVPHEMRLLPEARRIELKRREKSRALLVDAGVAGLAVIVSLGAFAAHVSNKENYLARLKAAATVLETQARPLERARMQQEIAARQRGAFPTGTAALQALRGIVPAGTVLTEFSFAHGERIVLRGHARQLADILALVSRMQESYVYKKLEINVGSVSVKKSPSGEILDFQVVCLHRS